MTQRPHFRALLFACLGCALATDTVRAACESRVEPIETPLGTTQVGKPVPAGKAAEIRSLKFEPPVTARVDADTVFTLDFEYRVADFAPETFYIELLVATGQGNSMPGSEFGESLKGLEVTVPAARVRMCLPLAKLFEATSVEWPLRISLIVLKRDEDSRRFSQAALQGPFKLVADTPQSALDRLAKMPPEIGDALMAAHKYFHQRALRYKACLERFPTMRAQLTPAYRAWEARHRKDIDLVSEMWFEDQSARNEGRADIAAVAMDHIAGAELEALKTLGESTFRADCSDLLERSQPADDLTHDMVGDSLEILREWKPKK